MSDFLNNLVTRSFQPAAIQPLAASRFAPAPERMDTPRALASAAAPEGEPFEDPFAQPSVDDPLAEMPPPASPPARIGRRSVSSVARIEEDQPSPPFTGAQSPEPIQPRITAAPPFTESIIESVVPPAREDNALPLSPSVAPKSERIATAAVADPLPVETLRPFANRRAEPAAPVVFNGELSRLAVHPQSTTTALAANQPPPAIQRENGIAPRQKLLPRPADVSLATRDRLPAPLPTVERVIIEQVTEFVETTDAEARMTLIPKPIAKPPLATNLNVRPKPRPQTQSPAPAPAPPETIVNVTIGRIEVRATPPLRTPAKPERQRNSAPVMGLDEYQRQRNGGSR